MENKGTFVNTSFKFSDAYPDILDNYIENQELYNKSNLLFLEEKYIEECIYFSYIVDKFKVKVFDDKLDIFTDNELKRLDDFSKEVSLFNEVIMNNNINGLEKYDLSISVNHFCVYRNSDSVKFVQLIYILIFLSSSTEFYENSFKFKVCFDDRETLLNVDFCERVSLDLFEIYTWIIDSYENINTRLKIIREIILRKQSFILTSEDLEGAKSAFNRVIKEETDKYFSQINMLKNDFLILSEQKRESFASLHLKLLAWGSSIALFIYGELKDIDSSNLISKLLFSKSEKHILFIIIFTITIIIIWLFFTKEVNESKKEFQRLKKFYTEKLFFEEKDFLNFIELPETPNIYNYTFLFIILTLIGRLLIPFIQYRF